jgi:uncharacterized protein
MPSSFPCIKCGICCKRLKETLGKRDLASPFLQKAIDEFPHPLREDGSCSQFIDGLCGVYESRPLLCNIDKIFDEHVKNTVSRREYHIFVAMSCNELIRQEGLDLSVDIP